MPKGPIRLGIVGVGKFARDHHLPSISANPRFELVAACDLHATLKGVSNFASAEEMLATAPNLDAITICTPPQTHYELARQALSCGKHVLVEKPPCASLSQARHLIDLASAQHLCLYQIWHSQHAPGVEPARRLLEKRHLRAAQVTWKEDVRIWHPGQAWIWQPGGFGVFDAGINALSILTRLKTEAIFARSCVLYIPSNCETPIAADALMQTESGTEIAVELDFRHRGTQTWDINFDTDQGPIKLSAGGGHLTVGDSPLPHDPEKLRSEYVSIYAQFADLVEQRRIDVDLRPLELVADLFLIGRREGAAPFVHGEP
jgi:D-galactose 1-dehydrogenase